MTAKKKASKRTRALVKAPAPEATLVVSAALTDSVENEDHELVERAIEHIRGVLTKTVTRGLDEVGRYLLREFYGDDPELYYSSSPSKHASLRILIERCESLEFPVSRTFLANALRLAATTKSLPNAATFRGLPPSHRVELLRVREPEKIERLATKVVDEKLSVLKLRALVQKEVDREKAASGRGRKATPVVLKAIDSCLRVLSDEGKLLIKRDDVAKLTEEQKAKADAALKSLERRVAELRRALG